MGRNWLKLINLHVFWRTILEMVPNLDLHWNQEETNWKYRYYQKDFWEGKKKVFKDGETIYSENLKRTVLSSLLLKIKNSSRWISYSRKRTSYQVLHYFYRNFNTPISCLHEYLVYTDAFEMRTNETIRILKGGLIKENGYVLGVESLL